MHQTKSEAEAAALALSRKDNLSDDAYIAMYNKNSDSFAIYPKVETLAFKVAKTAQYAGKDCCVHTHDEQGNLVSSQTTVYKLVMDSIREFSGDEVFYQEYNSGSKFHHEKPHMAMSKISFAKALRQAWPEILAGLITTEEAACELDFGHPNGAVIHHEIKSKSVQASDFDITKPDVIHPTPPGISDKVAMLFGNSKNA